MFHTKIMLKRSKRRSIRQETYFKATYEKHTKTGPNGLEKDIIRRLPKVRTKRKGGSGNSETGQKSERIHRMRGNS